MGDENEVLQPLRTWSHLAGQRRRPSEYEIVSTNLMYAYGNPAGPFELGGDQPLGQWFKKYQEGSLLKHENWEGFRDPDEMTYRGYNILQTGQETYVDGILQTFSDQEHDANIEPAWIDLLGRYYTPGRYLFHTLQMVSNYIVSIVPSSTIRNCVLYQAADELRVVSHISYRTAELGLRYPAQNFGTGERAVWEKHAAWQGFRELMEKLLVAYDWGESLIVLNLVAKPAVEEAFLRRLPRLARPYGDMLFGFLADAELRDTMRHREWTAALVRYALASWQNASVIDGWIAKWMPLADAAIAAFFKDIPNPGDAAEASRHAMRVYHHGLEVGQGRR